MTPEEYTELAYRFSEGFEEIYTEYLEQMGEQLKEIGSLSPSNVHRLEQMQIYGANIAKINDKLAKLTNLTLIQLSNTFIKMVKEDYSYAKPLYMYAIGKQIPFNENRPLKTMIDAIMRVTANTFENISNTTALSKAYKVAVDQAVNASTTGVSTYHREIHNIINEALNGSKITYESGYRRRLDSAVRMNVLEGIRQVNIETRNIMGEQFGSDGVEISAHMLCAIDHVGIQGRQFSNEDYAKMNADLKRHIGTLNCKHYIRPILLGISQPTYTHEELAKYKAYSEKPIEIDKENYSRYECSQIMRRLETATRYAKEKAIICRAAGDDIGYKSAKRHINDLRIKYNDVCAKAELKPRPERMYVPNYIKR